MGRYIYIAYYISRKTIHYIPLYYVVIFGQVLIHPTILLLYHRRLKSGDSKYPKDILFFGNESHSLAYSLQMFTTIA